MNMIDVARKAVGIVALPCPWCGEDPPLGRQIRQGWFTVGCESDNCALCPQVSAQTLSEAWRLWNKRAPVLTVVASNTDETLAGLGGIK